MAYFLSSPRSRSRPPAQRRAAWTAIFALLLQGLHGGAMAADGPQGGLTPQGFTQSGPEQTVPFAPAASSAAPVEISLEAALARLCTPSGIQTAAGHRTSPGTDNRALSCPFCPAACDGHALSEARNILAFAWVVAAPPPPAVSLIAGRPRHRDSRPRAPPALL